MKISTIEIKNYSRLHDLTIDVRNHAVIVGANDVGKTSLLRILNLALAGSVGQLYQQLTLDDLRDASAELVCDVQLSGLTDVERATFYLEPDVDPDDPADGTETLLLRLSVKADELDPEAVVVRRSFPYSGHDRGPTQEQLQAFGWRYLPAHRGTSAGSLEGPNSAVQVLLRALEIGDEKSGFAEILDSFNEKLKGSQALDTLRGSVADHLSKAMPKVIAKEDLAIRTTGDTATDAFENVSMFFEKDGSYTPIVEQSDGLRQLMAMTLFDLAEGSANIIAVDEPEIHLHPSSQRTVAELFAKSSNQRIIVTHSPYIVQRFEPSQVIAVKHDGSFHQISAAKLNAIQKVQVNWWSPRLLEALTARYAIVVEGVADRIIVDGVARALGMNLDQWGAVVLELDGADKFKHISKFIGPDGFDVKLLGLVDDKEKGSWMAPLGGKNAVGEALWVCTPDLEAEYCRSLGGPAVARLLIAAGACREDGMLLAAGVSAIDQLTDQAVAKFCGKNDRKTECAQAIAVGLTADTAKSITVISGLLDKLQILATTA